MYYYVKEEIYITESVLHFPIACEHKLDLQHHLYQPNM